MGFVHINRRRLGDEKIQGAHMLRWQVLVLAVTSIVAGHLRAQEVPFSSNGMATLIGRNICEIQGEFPKSMGVYLDRQKQHAVQYRERDSIVAIFLLSEPSSPKCGIVDAYLDLTPLVKSGETPEFKCFAGTAGGTTWGRWGHIVGLADNHGGKKRFVRARLAWRVNVAAKQFEPITAKTVTCDTRGYED